VYLGALEKRPSKGGKTKSETREAGGRRVESDFSIDGSKASVPKKGRNSVGRKRQQNKRKKVTGQQTHDGRSSQEIPFVTKDAGSHNRDKDIQLQKTVEVYQGHVLNSVERVKKV